MWISKKRTEISSTFQCARSFFYSFFHAWKLNSWNTPTAVSRGIFVFCSSAILVSLLLYYPSALSISAPRGASVENLHSVLPASSPCSFWSRTKERKKYSTDRKQDLPLRFRASLTDYARMIFRVARLSWFPTVSWRRSLIRLKMELMASTIRSWIFNIRSSPAFQAREMYSLKYFLAIGI